MGSLCRVDRVGSVNNGSSAAAIESGQQIPLVDIDEIYEELRESQVQVSDSKIYPKRMPGRWRNIKWWTSSVWLLFFLGPYLRWDDRQAVLLDLPNRQFHIFSYTVMPQDLWILAFILLFFAILLAVVTAVAGRVFCGYFCFQTVWTDVYVGIEHWLEGSPNARQKLDQQPWGFNAQSLRKLTIKLSKHSLWLLVAWLTGMSFVAWFIDAPSLWQGFAALQLPLTAWITIATFMGGTYLLAGFMREQVCLWMCPYSRIQGVMVDENTVVPAYDAARGEPRGHLKKGRHLTKGADLNLAIGDCIDCYQCVAVCPTGIDIRHGQQQGCITCGLCIDACDAVMDKIGRPRGLVRYASLEDLRGKVSEAWYKRLRVWVYLSIIGVSVGAVAYGFLALESIELNVVRQRQPLFVQLADGDIQNRYQIKVLNKTTETQMLTVAVNGPAGVELVEPSGRIMAAPLGVTTRDLFLRVPQGGLKQDIYPISFVLGQWDGSVVARRDSVFIAP